MKKLGWIELDQYIDDRGVLTVGEFGVNFPFKIMRFFFINDVKKNRGGHAHIDTDQVLIALTGQLTVQTFDGDNTEDFLLDNNKRALFIPRMVFVDLLNFSENCICLCLASTEYDIKRSIRNLRHFESSLRNENN